MYVDLICMQLELTAATMGSVWYYCIPPDVFVRCWRERGKTQETKATGYYKGLYGIKDIKDPNFGSTMRNRNKLPTCMRSCVFICICLCEIQPISASFTLGRSLSFFLPSFLIWSCNNPIRTLTIPRCLAFLCLHNWITRCGGAHMSIFTYLKRRQMSQSITSGPWWIEVAFACRCFVCLRYFESKNRLPVCFLLGPKAPGSVCLFLKIFANICKYLLCQRFSYDGVGGGPPRTIGQ